MSDIISLDPTQCPSFHKCSANLCPRDPKIKDRVWFVGEEICTSRQYGQRRWVRKQRSINKRQTKSYLNRPVTYQELFDNSRPRQLSPEQREALRQRIEKARVAMVGNVA